MPSPSNIALNRKTVCYFSLYVKNRIILGYNYVESVRKRELQWSKKYYVIFHGFQ